MVSVQLFPLVKKVNQVMNLRWGFAISLGLATLSILFFGALFAITGLGFIIQPFVQMIGGFLHPGKPMANMYFVLFSYSAYVLRTA